MIPCPALILAGGQSRRMGGGDKPLLQVAGKSLLARIIDTLHPQVTELALSANGPPQRFAAFGLPVLADSVLGHPGPLAGLLAGLDWALGKGYAACLSTAGDTPLVPTDLADRLWQASNQGQVPAICASGGRDHPVCGLWPVTLVPALQAALSAKRHGVWHFARENKAIVVEWDHHPVDPFLNINTQDDLVVLERILTPR